MDARLILELIVAPLQFRVLMVREDLDPELPERLADLVLNGVRGRVS